jgi:Domain of unknown function (DUF4159)
MRRALVLPIMICAMLAGTGRADPPAQEELVDRVKKSIDRGVAYLRREQAANGSWEKGGVGGIGFTTGGQTCLAMLALLNAGVPPTDPVILSGLNYVRRIDPQGTYVVGLQTMVLSEVNQPKDQILIQRNVQWLLQGLQNGRNFVGWGYGAMGPGADFSNTQYALLGLHAGKQSGATIQPAAWNIIRELYIKSQSAEGTWGYTVGDRQPRQTMTLAGLCGLLISGMELAHGQQQLDKDTGVAKRCGEYQEDDAIRRTLNWLAKPGNFSFDIGQHRYYNIYGIERAGRLSGQRFMADRDWYREGCEYLVGKQQDDGSWPGGGFDGGTVGGTAFALLFMSKGRTPILISKFAWGNDWNRKHYDIKHVVEYASRELFKKTPLAWQIYDCRNAPQHRIKDETAELLQSPILYLNGHDSPLRKLTGVQKEIMKKYVQEGGFIFAEACCGSPDFAKGFRELMKELFDKDMVPVPSEHALYHAHKPLTPQEATMFPLERLDLGCKTVVVLSTKPMAGWWEEDLYKSGRGTTAFQLAGNVIAYATNMELPKPKGFRVEIADDNLNVNLPRGYLKVGQVKHEGDWEPAPQAMRNLMLDLRARAKLDLSLQKEPVSITSKNMFQYRFLYMHGRRQFNFSDGDLKNLRANLKTGGLLLADACCGSSEFDTAFRAMATKLFPEARLEAIPDNDPLYGPELNEKRIEKVTCRRPRENGGALELQTIKPALEGIRLGKRWVVIYSKYDLGCALEKHPSSDCIGYDHESALRLAGAAVLYYLKN